MYKNVLITAHTHICENYYLLTIKNPEMAVNTKPGQFYMLTPYIFGEELSELYLKRPISVFDVNHEKGEISFYYQITGKGTKALSKILPGQEIEILGPLGRGFNTNIAGKKILLVGAGVGIAPLKYLFEVIKPNNNVHLLFGGRDNKALEITHHFNEYPSIYYCTDDGSYGVKDNAVDFTREIIELHKKEPFEFLYACAPTIVLKQVGKIAKELGIDFQLSLEKRMACGLRACMACSVKTLDGMKKVCADGPVFNGNTLLLDKI